MSEPFLKWPGGKRWLVNQYGPLFPTKFERYIEPFLGGGAVFFWLQPSKAIISDSNSDLVNAYRCIKKHPEVIEERLAVLQRKHDQEHYYRIRSTQPEALIEQAVRFIYLNRTCFNGIYRVNLKGEFNVPIGTKTAVAFPEGCLKDISKRLRGASITVSDFEETIDKAGSGDFLFVDPPYTVMHNNNNFLKYNANLFSWPDQKRLAAAVRRASRRGARVMISNADHNSLRELYANYGNRYRVRRATVLAADARHRRKTTELLITSYKVSKKNIALANSQGSIIEAI